ncbi:MAG: GNAT family N-acetyltransferase [Chloroflexi bacterium]|nr:GNAT family N-acetyltransferase [Chloroflexota bacterium]MCL5275478.1 GNAT family N-acetyltransferase [Chloroflexota bacterium]
MESTCFGWMRNVFGLWARVGQSNTFTWVAGMNEVPVGYLIAYHHELDGRSVMYVGGVGTLPQYRKRGVGTHLMHAVFAEYPQVWLHVRAGNANAIALYQNLGMQQLRRLTNFYSNGDDAIIMATSNMIPG